MYQLHRLKMPIVTYIGIVVVTTLTGNKRTGTANNDNQVFKFGNVECDVYFVQMVSTAALLIGGTGIFRQWLQFWR